MDVSVSVFDERERKRSVKGKKRRGKKAVWQKGRERNSLSIPFPSFCDDDCVACVRGKWTKAKEGRKEKQGMGEEGKAIIPLNNPSPPVCGR